MKSNLGMSVVLSPVLRDLEQMSFGEYQLNIVASDRVSVNRSLPDLRDSKCLNIKYPSLLPTATGNINSMHIIRLFVADG